MELKNYVLITTVILAFALISINLEDMTGLATRSELSKITVTPSIINSGERITINVIPGIRGVKNEVKIYSECNNPIIENCQGSPVDRIHLCSGSSYSVTCRNTIKKVYTTPIGLKPGMYYARIIELNKDSNGNYLEQKAYFKVE